MSKENCYDVGDVFTTTFWGVPEVCIIMANDGSEIVFIRLESIRKRKGIKKDFCAAALPIDYFGKIQKTFIHHSQWYYEYKEEKI